jgi:hypothetical protein
MQIRRRSAVAGLSLACSTAWWGPSAWALDKPAAPVVLTLRGKVGTTNDAGAAHFDMAMLGRMAQRSISTRTPWYDGPRKFTGPLLRDVLQAAGAKGTGLRAIALNDYKVDIPFEDTQKFDVVLARLLDDKPMPVREKGPLFIIYPFDDKPELRVPQYFARCAWQLRTIEIV